jgi:hypothetical protein
LPSLLRSTHPTLRGFVVAKSQGPDSKKFFGSFFQKRTASLALLP